MRLVVTGGSGQLARAMKSQCASHEVILPPEAALDLSDAGRIRSVLEGLEPQIVVNAGAFTQVDRCETEEALAMRINGDAVGTLAEVCSDIGAVLVQVSTDYVFDGTGNKPYREEDPVCPLSVYGKSKLLGERNASRAREHLIVRTAWLYETWGNNFYNTMLRLAAEGRPIRVVNDQHGSPTSCRALARQILAALEQGWRGMLHAVCAGETTWYGFAEEIFKQHGLRVDLSPCATSEFQRQAPRPSYSVLACERLQRLGGNPMPDWRESLAEVVREKQLGGSA